MITRSLTFYYSWQHVLAFKTDNHQVNSMWKTFKGIQLCRAVTEVWDWLKWSFFGLCPSSDFECSTWQWWLTEAILSLWTLSSDCECSTWQWYMSYWSDALSLDFVHYRTLNIVLDSGTWLTEVMLFLWTLSSVKLWMWYFMVCDSLKWSFFGLCPSSDWV